jgi:hypothetical protein
VGGVACTSVGALDRFFAKLAAARIGASQAPQDEPAEEEEEELDERGF